MPRNALNGSQGNPSLVQMGRLRSPSDNLRMIQAKMQEYLDSGVQLGWLLNPEDQQAEIYRPDHTVEILQAPASLSGETVLPGLTLNLKWLWRSV